jgi:hypothetical protein
MNLQNKLKGLPIIYYTNLDHRIDRREYMETQFDYWGITNYHRVSSSKYLSTEEYKWEHLVLDKFLCFGSAAVANSITHLKMIKNWLETTNDEYMIMMEDDYDLSLIEYWNFDWEYLMNHIPFDWDGIQLGFESFILIHFFLHPKAPKTYFGAFMINRNYAKKLIRLYYRNGKYVIDNEISDIYNLQKNVAKGSVDYSICNNGKIYCIPLIPQNPHFSSHENFNTKENEFRDHIINCYNLYYNWWKNEHHKFTLEDFFTYGKPNDYEMTRYVQQVEVKNISQYY